MSTRTRPDLSDGDDEIARRVANLIVELLPAANRAAFYTRSRAVLALVSEIVAAEEARERKCHAQTR